MNDEYIKFQNVNYSYDSADEEVQDDKNASENSSASVLYTVNQRMAVENISFTVKKGEFVAIAGRNGSGKSTVARLTNALLAPDSGTVIIDGIDTLNEEMIWNIRSNVGMVFQNPDNQIVGMSVEEDIAFGLENLGVPRDEMIVRVDKALEVVKLSSERKTEPHLLSGGQKQRVAIAGILAMQPKCIVLDEATAMLDPTGRKDVIDTVRKLNKENGITIILITHHMDEIVYADRVMLIDSGKLVATGTPKEIFSQNDLIEQSGLELPQTATLFAELKKSGYDVPNDILSVDEAYEYISSLISDKKGGDSYVN